MLDVTEKREAQRQVTVDRILDAFERVLLRDGVRNVGANAVMKEAGISKPQLYKYFGGIPGLIREWGRRRPFWPTHEELSPPGEEAYDDPKVQLKRRLIRLAKMLRDRPIALEVLADELVAPEGEISKAFAELRQKRGEADREKFGPDHPVRQRENFRLVHVMFAAIVYFALRARRNPQLQGIDLHSEEGWNDTIKMIEEIIDDSILASKVRELLGS